MHVESTPQGNRLTTIDADRRMGSLVPGEWIDLLAGNASGPFFSVGSRRGTFRVWLSVWTRRGQRLYVERIA